MLSVFCQNRRTMSKENRQYKSSIFTMLLEDKSRALDVYNAVNNTSYDNVDNLEILMLENAVYLTYRNDASFVFSSMLNLYEHQSTYNPNMPLRDLIYVTNLIAELVKDEDLYGRKLIRIPTPQFVTFYNGVEEQPERVEMRLSDAYMVATDNPQLELKCTFININPGNNLELMSKCKTMREYMIFVDKVRKYRQTMNLEIAIDVAMEECIMEHVLEEFMKSQKAQVKSMSVLEFNLEKHLNTVREEGREEGAELKMITKICQKIQKGKTIEAIAEELEEDEEYVKRVCEIANRFAPEYDIKKIYKELCCFIA